MESETVTDADEYHPTNTAIESPTETGNVPELMDVTNAGEPYTLVCVLTK